MPIDKAMYQAALKTVITYLFANSKYREAMEMVSEFFDDLSPEMQGFFSNLNPSIPYSEVTDFLVVL